MTTNATVPFDGNDAHQLVSEVASALLGLREPSAGLLDQDLYELGFDSLSLFRLRSRIVQLTHVALDVEELFQVTTLKDLADVLDRSLREPSLSRPEPVGRRNEKDASAWIG